MDLISMLGTKIPDILNKNDFIKEDDKKAYKTFFVALAKEVENGLIVGDDEVYFYKINYQINPQESFSESHLKLFEIYKNLLVLDCSKEYEDLLFGTYNKETDSVSFDGLIKNFKKLDSMSLVDYFFTKKGEEIYNSKEFIERECNLLFKAIVDEILISPSLTLQNFDSFLFSYEMNVDNLKDLDPHIQSENIKLLLQNVFPCVEKVASQFKLTKVLVKMGFFEMRLLYPDGSQYKEYDDIPIEKGEPTEILYLIGGRGAKIYKRK